MRLQIIITITLISLLIIACDENPSSLIETLTPFNDSLIIKITDDTIISDYNCRLVHVDDVPSIISFTIDDYFLNDPSESYIGPLSIYSTYLTGRNMYDPDIGVAYFDQVEFGDTFSICVDTGLFYCSISAHKGTIDLSIKTEKFDIFESEFEPNNDFKDALYLPIDSIQRAYIGFFSDLSNGKSIYERKRYNYDKRDCYYFDSDSGATYYLTIKSNRDDSIVNFDSLFVADRQGYVTSILSDLHMDDGVVITATSQKTYLLFYVEDKKYSYNIQIEKSWYYLVKKEKLLK